MKSILTLIAILILSNNCYSQSGWIQENSGTPVNLNSVKFINSQTGWCVGDSGKILKTTTGGTNWIQQSSGFIYDLRSLFFTSVNAGYAVGDSGLVLKTSNAGISWNRLSLIKPQYMFKSVYFINNYTGFVGGFYFNTGPVPHPNMVFKTTDEGASWDSIEIAPLAEYTRSIFFINANTGWATGGSFALASEIVAKTSNGGEIWSFQYSSNAALHSIHFADTLNGWLTGTSSVSTNTILRSTNGGNNWITEFPGLGFTAFSLNFTNNNKGWACGENRRIYSTSNGGINWIAQTSHQSGISYRSIFFVDSLTGWAVGDSGKILKTTTGGLTFINNNHSEIPSKFKLYQNYPNPFNPNTIINYQLSIINSVEIKIYDVLGNKVVTLVNEKNKSPGSYEVEFDGSNFASGIYFYRLEVDGEMIDTKRMVLLK